MPVPEYAVSKIRRSKSERISGLDSGIPYKGISVCDFHEFSRVRIVYRCMYTPTKGSAEFRCASPHKESPGSLATASIAKIPIERELLCCDPTIISQGIEPILHLINRPKMITNHNSHPLFQNHPGNATFHIQLL